MKTHWHGDNEYLKLIPSTCVSQSALPITVEVHGSHTENSFIIVLTFICFALW